MSESFGNVGEAADVRNRDRRGFRRAWAIAFVVGELIGFVPPAVAGALLVVFDAPPAALVAGLVVAGAIEGIVLGVAQVVVFRRFDVRIRSARWVLATAGGAAIAWLAGMGGSVAIEIWGPGLWWLVGPCMFIGLIAMGSLQWLELRRVAQSSAGWIVVSSAAWLIGVLIPVAALSLVPNNWPVIGHVAVGVSSAVLMGAVVGALTGGYLAQRVVPPPAADVNLRRPTDQPA